MSATPRLLVCTIVLAVLATACDGAAFTADPGAGAEDQPTSTTVAPTPASGCAFAGVVGDADLEALVCRYQALLVQALSSGVVVDAALMEQVTAAVATAAIDPQNARSVVEAAIAQIEQLLSSVVPEALTPTVGDLTDSAFGCMARASELLALAFERQTVGGVVIPEMESWQAAFNDAATLAEAGDVAGATAQVCDLNTAMEAVLFQS